MIKTSIRLLCFLVAVMAISMAVSVDTTAQNIDEHKFAAAVTRLMEASTDGFRDVIAGSGRDIQGTTTYPCSIPIPGASKTIIRSSADLRPYVSAQFYDGADKAYGKKLYAELVAQIKKIVPDWDGKEKERDDDKYFDFYPRGPSDDSATMSLHYNPYKFSEGCEVSLTIWSPRSVTPQAISENKKTVPWRGGVREDAVRKVVKQFVARDFEGIRARFNSQMKMSLSTQALEQGWNSLIQQTGVLKSQDEPQSRTAHGFDVVAIICRMERGAIEVEVYFDTNGEIGGLWLRPVSPF